MAISPPGSPTGAGPQRPISAMMRTPRSTSRMSTSSKHGGGSRASDEDGKTAVKVAVRVRPPLRPTDPGYDLIPQRFQRSMVHVTSPTSLAVDVPQGRKLFVFDRVFPETVDQEGIWEYLSDSVNSFLQGYNVSILAYGQSGAGKSYTMGTSGPSEQNDPKAMGIIPRAAQLLFEALDGPQKGNRNSVSGLRTPARYSMSSTSSLNKHSFDKNWQLKATYVEIYNEQLRDLLVPDTMPVADRGTVTIRQDAKGRILLTGLHQVNINSFEDLIGALNFGSSIRQTDSTAINAKSSRSHAVFSLNLVQRKSTVTVTSPREKRMSMPIEALSGTDTSITVDSKLHFVDLAGSERLKNTQASGERAREGISINAGLAALGKVISQLSSRQGGSHVSYRDSTLTRLLQDSLGGNAITYMIACVTPAEFHLSETLNTVQYAQRARAIQSKPRIQQVADDSDKQAVIERLKAEVAFLRQQIRNSEGNERRNVAPQDRSERQNERELDLQNQLLDAQESYNALSQRHAKLIAELTKGPESAGELDDLASAVGESSVERLKRSSSFAESVEQVVLEYEKTIQSLESSLSNTRSSLAVTESTLLERETKCAYVETVNSQLQSRIQKLMDREASTETYIHELEARLDGQSSGEEQHAAIVADLRKELARARASEANCEEYISTLEERLAEADQDMELMQREMERLEHVIDRQRSLGKLDNLLYELDHIQQNGANGKSPDAAEVDAAVDTEPYVAPSRVAQHSRKRTMSLSLDVLSEAAEVAIPESDDDLVEPIPEMEDDTAAESEPAHESGDSDLKLLEEATSKLESGENPALVPPSPAQSKFVADKLETVTQELFDLRMQHEATVSDYELLEAKYEEALRALAEMRQDAADEARHAKANTLNNLMSPQTASRPISFLEETKPQQPSKVGGRHGFSQSLSSELSLAGESAASPAMSHAHDDATQDTSVLRDSPEDDEGVNEPADMEQMRMLLSEHQEGVSLMTKRYAELQAEHEDTLELVESLKAEVQKAKSNSPPTTPGFKAPVIRRVTSMSFMSNVDRAHRSLAALRNVAVEAFEGRPETMQNFESHLDAAMHELHTRMERIQALEAENQSVKKEMEMKSTIISGLTRERSSLQGVSPVDMSVVSQLRDQVVQQENQIRVLKEAHDLRERQLLAEIAELNALLLSAQDAAAAAATAAASTPNGHVETAAEHQQTIATLESELAELKSKYEAAMAQGANADEQSRKIESLEQELTEWKNKHQEAVARGADAGEQERRIDALDAELAEWKAKHEDALAQAAVAQEQASRIAALERDLADWQGRYETATSSQGADAEDHARRITSLEGELTEWKSKHQTAVDSLQTSESKLAAALAELDAALASVEALRADRTSADDVASADKEAAAQHLESERAQQEEVVEKLREEIESHKSTIASQLETIAGLESSHAAVQEQLAASLASKDTDAVDAETHRSRIADLEREIEAHRSAVDSHKAALDSLRESHAKELDELEARAAAAAQAEYESRLAEKDAEHEAAMNALRTEILESRQQLQTLLKTVSGILNSDVTPANLADQLEDLMSQKQHVSQKYADLIDTNEELLRQLALKSGLDRQVEELNKKNATHEAKVNELALLVATLEDTVRQKDEQIKKKDALVEEIEAEKQKSIRLVEELEEQITNSFDQHHNRLSVIQQERDQALEEAKAKIAVYERDIETYRVRIEQLELQIKNSGGQDGVHDRTSSLTSNLRKSGSAASLPSPPPAIPLPPLPNIASATSPTTITNNNNPGSVSPPSSKHTSKELVSAQLVEDQEARIRTIEKHLYAEKQLTATLEEALGDLEAQSNKVKTDCEAWKKKAVQLEEELTTLRKERASARLSLQAVEEERSARREAEAARAQLEERMNALNKKKKKSTLNCF